MTASRIHKRERISLSERRDFLKLLLSLSGIGALLHFAKYGSYLSPDPKILESRTERTATVAKTYVAPEIKWERTKIANLSEIPPGSEMIFNWPAGLGYGGTDILVRDEAGDLHAFNLVCTHLHCLAEYSSEMHLIVCPCHGSVFRPSTGELAYGPARGALPVINLEVDTGGDIYAVGHEGDFGRGRSCRTDCGT